MVLLSLRFLFVAVHHILDDQHEQAIEKLRVIPRVELVGTALK